MLTKLNYVYLGSRREYNGNILCHPRLQDHEGYATLVSVISSVLKLVSPPFFETSLLFPSPHQMRRSLSPMLADPNANLNLMGVPVAVYLLQLAFVVSFPKLHGHWQYPESGESTI